MRNARLIIFCFFYPFIAFCTGEKDSLPRIEFTSEFERKCFREFYEKSKTDLFSLMLCGDSSMSNSTREEYYSRLNDFFKKNDAKITKERDPVKKVSLLYKSIHHDFLVKYDTIVRFDGIFKSGNYNCVTATALYSIVFDHYGIKNQVKETPHHVYLIADPEGTSVWVESTTPLQGYYVQDDKFRKRYVDYLLAQKMIDKEELEKKGYKDIFDRFFYSDTNINAYELAGLQYYNEGIEYYRAQKLNRAIPELEKALLLYPKSKNIRLLLQLCIYNEMQKRDFSRREDILLLSKYYNYTEKKTEELQRELIGEFEKVTQRVLIDKNEKVIYTGLYQEMTANLSDSALKSKVGMVYSFNISRAYYMEGKFDLALDYIVNAYLVSPNNIEINSMLSNIIIEKTRHSNNSEKTLAQLDAYVAKYPSLINSSIILRYYALCYLWAAETYFISNNTTSGNQYLRKFEDLADNKQVELDQNLIGRAYGEAWRAYYRLSNRSEASRCVKAGLKYAPESRELLEKQRWIEEANR